MKALVVDWLGRGGIADCTTSWLIEARSRGTDLTVVTRRARFTPPDGVEMVESEAGRFAVHAHLRVVGAAVAAIRERRPDLVLLQNYVIPAAEQAVVRAARSVGARLVFVVHDHRLHSRLAGTSAGLRAGLRAADDVVVHSEFVGTALAQRYGRRPQLVPLPMPLGLVEASTGSPPFDAPPGRLATHFGVLKRRYKGTSVVAQLAREGVPGWSFAFLGVGAPTIPGSISLPSFLSAEDLVGAVRASEAALLPYRLASQSGAVLLAQSLGVVPIATSVGGIPEQIEHGTTGFLVGARAPASEWRQILHELGPERSAIIGSAARQAVHAGHRQFSAWVASLFTANRSR